MGKARELVGRIEMKKCEWAINLGKDYSNILLMKESQWKRAACGHFNSSTDNILKLVQ